MKYYIGLDVSMQKTFICIVDEIVKVIHEAVEKTDPQLIADYLSKIGIKDMLIGFESGSLSNYLMTSFKVFLPFAWTQEN